MDSMNSIEPLTNLKLVQITPKDDNIFIKLESDDLKHTGFRYV